MGMFEDLLRVDSALVDWLIHATPTTDDDRAKMKALFAQRGDLDDALNELVSYRLKLAVANLPAETAKLSAAAAAMESAAKTIDNLQKVVTAVGTALEVAGKLVAFVAGGGI